VRYLRLKLYNIWPGQTNHKYTHTHTGEKRRKFDCYFPGKTRKRISPLLLGRRIRIRRRSSCSRRLRRRRLRTWSPGPSPPSRYLPPKTLPLLCPAAFSDRLSALLTLLLLLLLVLPSMMLFGIICMPQRCRRRVVTARAPLSQLLRLLHLGALFPIHFDACIHSSAFQLGLVPLATPLAGSHCQFTVSFSAQHVGRVTLAIVPLSVAGNYFKFNRTL